MAYPDTLLRGLITPGSVTSERYVTAEAFQFQDFRQNRSDNYNELSINWEDSDEAVDVLLKQKKEGSEDPQFKIGFARMSFSRIKDVFKPHISDKTYSYERKPVDGNPYHGNLLADAKLSKQIVKNIQHSLATIATADVYLRSDENIKYLKKEHKTMPKVSVLVPVYGVEKYIERCARSLFEQTLDDIEFIFVDDCTPDRSIDILKVVIEKFRLRFGEKKYVVRIERMPMNSGQGAVRRHGIQLATGDYITFCDSDDFMPEDAVESLYNLAVESDADIVSGDMEWLYDDGTTKRSYISLPYGSDRESVYRALLSKEYSHTLCSKLFKNSLLQEHEYITLMNHTNGEDGMLFYQVLQYANKVVHKNAVVYSYYQNSQSSTHVRIKDNALSLLVDFYNYVVNIPYKNTYLKHLAICYSTDCVNEFALTQGYKRMKQIVDKKGTYPYLSFSYRMKYLTVKQNLRWYAKLILNYLQLNK